MAQKIPIVCFVLGFCFFGCKVQPPTPPLPLETIAVLPFDNESNEIDAPEIMQRLVYLALVRSRYRILNYEKTNTILEEKGIIDGGQLPVLDPTQIAKDLGAQGLMYGYVENFGYLNVGFYTERKVTLELTLIDGSTGETLWTEKKTGAKRNITFDEKEAQEQFAKGLADQLVDKLSKIPLFEESRLAVRKTLKSLPGFKFNGFAEDDKTPSKAKRATNRIIKDQIKKK
jgi:TolB-like protein